jgi:hypothetical protein
VIDSFKESVCHCIDYNGIVTLLPSDMLRQFRHIPGELSVSSKNLPIVHIGLAITTDETSGNTTKRWNHFENVFMKISNLPARETGLHLIASGNNVTWSELCDASLCDFHQGGPMEQGFRVWNAHERQWNDHRQRTFAHSQASIVFPVGDRQPTTAS